MISNLLVKESTDFASFIYFVREFLFLHNRNGDFMKSGNALLNFSPVYSYCYREVFGVFPC